MTLRVTAVLPGVEATPDCGSRLLVAVHEAVPPRIAAVETAGSPTASSDRRTRARCSSMSTGCDLRPLPLLPTGQRPATASGRSFLSPASVVRRGRARRSTLPAIADQLGAELDDALDIGTATLVGNSMGCPGHCEFDHLHHYRLERAVLRLTPAGGLHPVPRPCRSASSRRTRCWRSRRWRPSRSRTTSGSGRSGR